MVDGVAVGGSGSRGDKVAGGNFGTGGGNRGKNFDENKKFDGKSGNNFDSNSGGNSRLSTEASVDFRPKGNDLG